MTPHDAIYATITIQLPAGDLLGQGNNVPVIDREDLAQMAPLLSNAVDYDAMTAENAVLLSEEYGKAGDSVTLELRGKDGDPYEWQATVAATYDPSKLMENVPIVPGSPTFLLTADSATTLTGVTDLTGVLTIACADGAYDSVRAQVMQLAEASDEFDETDISQTIKNIEEINAATLRNLRLVAVILLLFGGISLANTLIVDLRNRRQEVALLGVIGATRRQLVQMLRWELGDAHSWRRLRERRRSWHRQHGCARTHRRCASLRDAGAAVDSGRGVSPAHASHRAAVCCLRAHTAGAERYAGCSPYRITQSRRGIVGFFASCWSLSDWMKSVYPW